MYLNNVFFYWKYIYLQDVLFSLKMEGFPGGATGKESACNAGDRDANLIPGSGRSGEGNDSTPVFLHGEFHGQRSLAGY